MNSSSAKTFTRVKLAVLFLALLIVPEFAFAQDQKKPAPPPKTAPAKAAPAPAKPPTTSQHPPDPQQKTPQPQVHPVGPPHPKSDGGGQIGKGPGADSGKGKGSVGGGSSTDPGNGKGNGGGNGTNLGNEKGKGTDGRRPLPGGGTRETHTDGSSVDRDKSGRVTSVTTRNNTTAKFNSRGSVATIHAKNGMTIQHGPNGSRRIESTRADGAKVVSDGHGSGYVEHVSSDGRTATRTYQVNGRTFTRVYSRTYYGGHYYYGYVPGYYYGPAFYGWAYNPWAAPVYWGWGWPVAGWYGYYGAYFGPAPFYPTASLWLTDNILAANLRAAYEAGPGGTSNGTQSAGQSAGLAFAPVLASGTRNLASGFSIAGNSGPTDDRLVLNAGGTATFTFSVPAGQAETVAYNIPAGGYLDSVPFEVSVNSVTVATVDKDPNYRWGDMTQVQRPLWKQAFTPGDYALTIRSGGCCINFYGLWLGMSPNGSQDTEAQTDPTTAGKARTPQNPNADLTAEVKQAIAGEVQVQISAEEASAANTGNSSDKDVPAALNPKDSIFIVSSTLSEQVDDGQSCSLTGGDILTRITTTPDTNQNVKVLVTTAKKDDCATGTQFAMSIQDLQDMYNDFQAKTDEGLKELAQKQGKGGIPASPAPGGQANPAAAGATADPNAAATLKDQDAAAAKAEGEIDAAIQTPSGN